MCERLRAAMAYLVKETFTRKDFYLLWLTRFDQVASKFDQAASKRGNLFFSDSSS